MEIQRGFKFDWIRNGKQYSIMIGLINVDQTVLKQMYQHSPFGFAYQRVVFDRDGAPEDYVFLYVNPAFEELTGLFSKKILNQRVSKVLPGIRSGDFDLSVFMERWFSKTNRRFLNNFLNP